VAGLDEPFGLLMLELPMRDCGFILPTWEELNAIVEAAHDRGARVHFDGARLWESAVHFGRDLPAVAALADSVYVSFYKSLGGLSGAVLAGPQDLIRTAKALRHRYGGLPYQQFPQALAALAGLQNELPRLPDYIAHAQAVAKALSEAFAASDLGFRVYPEPPHTHEFQVWAPYPADVLELAGLQQALDGRMALFGRWRDVGRPPGMALTEVTIAASGLEWSLDEVTAATRDFGSRVAAMRAGSGRP
jgi:threonine aldolase